MAQIPKSKALRKNVLPSKYLENSDISNYKFEFHCTVAFIIRSILIVYAKYHDKYFAVPYTDVDYKVFTDAARYITEDASPFQRHTYRYSPLLALSLIPNIYWYQEWGKTLFSVIDILVAQVIKTILSQNYKSKTAEYCALLWLYNPLTIIISTRGNADSLAVLLVLLTLYFMQNDQFIAAGLIHGLSVHFRLYPFAFSLVMYLSLREKNWLIPNVQQVKLVLACALSLFDLTVVFYKIYGYKFLYESFLYHLMRKDVRHNFSAYFYMLYLSAKDESSIMQKMFTFIPQLTILIILAFRYSCKRDLSFAFFTQALVMVMYNPVITSQYFFWFLSLLPLILPDLEMSFMRILSLTISWVASQGIWLYAAYLLEFHGLDSFNYIWLTSLIFFLVHVKILVDIISCYKPSTEKKQ